MSDHAMTARVFEIHERLGVSDAQEYDQIMLTHEERDKGRLRATTKAGNEARIFLDRGRPLAVGELLRATDSTLLRVAGARERVVRATCDDWEVFSRACYHLGNRHVKLEIGERWLRMVPDHVLEEMLVHIGLTCIAEEAVFVPEPGAYGGTHRHGHGHGHDH